MTCFSQAFCFFVVWLSEPLLRPATRMIVRLPKSCDKKIDAVSRDIADQALQKSVPRIHLFQASKPLYL